MTWSIPMRPSCSGFGPMSRRSRARPPLSATPARCCARPRFLRQRRSAPRYSVTTTASRRPTSRRPFTTPTCRGLTPSSATTRRLRYYFYPFQPGCWVQQGARTGPGSIYWVTIDYLPTVGTAGGPYLFGAKTAKTHLLDDAVHGHLNADNVPLGDWVDLIDPRTNNSLDLAHALWNSLSTASTKTWPTTDFHGDGHPNRRGRASHNHLAL